jgi:hypothetical protein
MSALPFGTAVISSSAQRDAAKILIGGHEIFAVHVNTRGNWILVRLTTNAGIGEASQGASDAATLRYLAQFAARLSAFGTSSDRR